MKSEEVFKCNAQSVLKATKVSVHAFMKYRRDNPDYDAAVQELDNRKLEKY